MPKTKDNANDALVVNEVSQEEIDAFDLSPHLIRLLWDEPFFANVLRGIEKIKTINFKNKKYCLKVKT